MLKNNKDKDSIKDQSCSTESSDSSQNVSLRHIIMSVLEENSPEIAYEAD